MYVVAGLACALTLLSLSACSDLDTPAGNERGIDADIRATHDAGPTLRNLGIYNGPQMSGEH